MDRICDIAYGALVELGADPQHAGFPALLSCAAIAAQRQQEGKRWTAHELMNKYAQFKGKHWAEVWITAAQCLGGKGLRIAPILAAVVDKVGKEVDA